MGGVECPQMAEHAGWKFAKSTDVSHTRPLSLVPGDDRFKCLLAWYCADAIGVAFTYNVSHTNWY